MTATSSPCDFETLTSRVCTQRLPWKNPAGTKLRHFNQLTTAFPHQVSDDYSYKVARSEHICPLKLNFKIYKMFQIMQWFRVERGVETQI